MALVVEDGTGLANANSYISVADADTYFADRNNTDWDNVEEKEAALILATDYMVSMYRLRWKGYKVLTTQALDWPRYEVDKPDSNYACRAFYESNEIPIEIKRACAELALRSVVTGGLTPDVSSDDQLSSVKVGPIELSYKEGSSPVKTFRQVSAILAPFIVGSNGMGRLVRT